jgi:hypothetical protein
MVVEKIDKRVGEFFVACSFKNVEDYFTWAFACVYGPNVYRDIRLVWDLLNGLLS